MLLKYFAEQRLHANASALIFVMRTSSTFWRSISCCSSKRFCSIFIDCTTTWTHCSIVWFHWTFQTCHFAAHRTCCSDSWRICSRTWLICWNQQHFWKEVIFVNLIETLKMSFRSRIDTWDHECRNNDIRMKIKAILKSWYANKRELVNR